MKKIIVLLLILSSGTISAAPNILNVGGHAAGSIASSINDALGSGKVDNPLFVDYDTNMTLGIAISDAQNPSSTNIVSVASGNPVNHAPYFALNASYANLVYTAPNNFFDINYYASLLSSGMMFSLPLAVQEESPSIPSGIGPPVSAVVVSSANSSNGGTGWGITLGIPVSYKGLSTTFDSQNSAYMGGFLLALKYNHSTWNPFDINAALRQTASRWATGYDHTQFGFGLLDWDSANAIASTSSLYLQGPGLTVYNHGYYANLLLFPFRQTRRQKEVVYSVSSSYTWPVKNEYTATDIAASGGTLLFTSNGSDVTPQFTYTPPATGSVTFVAFTIDGAGGYSRVEEFSENTQSFLVGTRCNQ